MFNKNIDMSFANDQKNNEYAEIEMGANYGNDTENDWIDAGGGTAENIFDIQDDNVSHVGSDFSEIQLFEQDNLFGDPNSPDLYGEQLQDAELKFDNSHLMLRPPSSSALHFNYKIPAMLKHTEPDHSRTNTNFNLPPTDNYDQSQISYYYQSGVSSTSTAVTPFPAATPLPASTPLLADTPLPAATPLPSTSTYSTNLHSNQGSFHPNMWYPNAPFGTYRSCGSTYGHHYGSQISHDNMADMLQSSSSSREARNRAEKNRRDKLNGCIQELSTLVPHVAESPRRVDKTAVLRFATHGLRLKYVFGKSLNNESTQTTDALMQLLDSFFLTMTCNGQIVLVSSSIEQHLGHCQADLYGQNILHITHPEDHQMLREKLIPTDLEKLFDIQTDQESGEPAQRTQAEEDEIDRALREDKRSFTVRLAKAGPKSDPATYELVKIEGSFRRSDMATRGLKTSSFPSALQLMRRNRSRGEIMTQYAISSNDIVLIAIARIVRPPVINRAIEANSMEYKTRHLIDGRIIDCDQRISLVAGYMTDEVRNLSPFTFIHQDDVRWVIVALRQMYDCNSSYGESTYRLFTRNGKIIYLHTKGFLEINKQNNKVHSFICVNTQLDEDEGKQRVDSMKKKFSVIINTKIPQPSNDVPASENPQQLEKAVLCLIKNLKSDDDGDSETFPSTSSYSKKSHSQSHNIYPHYGSTSPPTRRSTKTPPLALVPPAADSIKNSITKSVNVVKTTAAKFLHSGVASCPQQENVLDDNCALDNLQENIMKDDIVNIFYSHNAGSEGYLTNSEQEVSRHYTSSGAVKRKISYNILKTDDDDEYNIPLQRQAIENVLSTSLQQINNRLNEQLNTAMELRDQGQRYEVPHTEERIANILKEHQLQREMYENITNEFEVQRINSEIGSSDCEMLHQYLKHDLDEAQQSHEQGELHRQQQCSTQPEATTQKFNNTAADTQHKCENNL